MVTRAATLVQARLDDQALGRRFRSAPSVPGPRPATARSSANRRCSRPSWPTPASNGTSPPYSARLSATSSRLTRSGLTGRSIWLIQFTRHAAGLGMVDGFAPCGESAPSSVATTRMTMSVALCRARTHRREGPWVWGVQEGHLSRHGRSDVIRADVGYAPGFARGDLWRGGM